MPDRCRSLVEITMFTGQHAPRRCDGLGTPPAELPPQMWLLRSVSPAACREGNTAPAHAVMTVRATGAPYSHGDAPRASIAPAAGGHGCDRFGCRRHPARLDPTACRCAYRKLVRAASARSGLYAGSDLKQATAVMRSPPGSCALEVLTTTCSVARDVHGGRLRHHVQRRAGVRAPRVCCVQLPTGACEGEPGMRWRARRFLVGSCCRPVCCRVCKCRCNDEPWQRVARCEARTLASWHRQLALPAEPVLSLVQTLHVSLFTGVRLMSKMVVDQ